MSRQREREERRGAQAAPAAHERDERDQPDHVLRREHLPERDVGDHRGGGGADEALAAGLPRANQTQVATIAAAWTTDWSAASAFGSEPPRFCEPWLETMVAPRPNR